jgi:hypothetical protein
MDRMVKIWGAVGIIEAMKLLPSIFHGKGKGWLKVQLRSTAVRSCLPNRQGI